MGKNRVCLRQQVTYASSEVCKEAKTLCMTELALDFVASRNHLKGGSNVGKQGGGHAVGQGACCALAHEQLHIIHPLHVLCLLCAHTA